MFKKFILIILVVAVLGTGAVLWCTRKTAQYNQNKLAAFTQETTYTNQLGNVLVVYYSWTNHTREIAEQIAALTHADVYRIQTQEEFKSSPAFYAKIKKQLEDKNYPALTGQLPDASRYDVIFVGAPVWWYTLATPLYTFLGEMDFQGKRVIPFSTQGSDAGMFLADFKAHAKNAQVGTYAGFNNVSSEYDQAVRNKVITWLNGL